MQNIPERIEGFLNRLERAEAFLLEGRVVVSRDRATMGLEAPAGSKPGSA